MAMQAYYWMTCKWCRATGKRGCTVCQGRNDRVMKEAQEPLVVVKADTEEEMRAELRKLKPALGAEALEHAFGPDGGGVNEVLENLARIQNDNQP